MKASSIALTAVLGMALLTAFSANSLGAQEQTDAYAGLPVELRTRESTHYRLPDGTVRAVITARPQNYQDAQGVWHAIDPTLVPGHEFAFVNLTNGLNSRFPHSIADGVSVSGLSQPDLRMTPIRFLGVDEDGLVVSDNTPMASAAVQRGDRTVHYPGLFFGVTDEYVVDTDRLKHNLVVDYAAMLDMKKSAVFGAEYRVRVPAGLRASAAEGGRTVQFLDTSGDCIYELGAVIAVDAVGASVDGKLTFTTDSDSIVVRMTIPTSWALDDSRQWPIRIDPTVTLQPDPTAGKDTMVRAQAPTSNYGTGTSIGSNYGNTSGPLHILIQFDLSSIPSTSLVTAASFELWHWSNTVTGNVFEVYEVTGAWQESSVNWSNKPPASPTMATSLTYPSGSAAWRAYPGMAALAQKWVSTPTSNNGYYIINATQDYMNAYHYSSDYTTDPMIRPKFIVDYPANPDGTVMFNSSPAAGHLTLPETDLVLLDLKAQAFGMNYALNSLTVAKTGNMADATIQTLKLVADLNDNGAVDATDGLLSQGALTSGQITFSAATPPMLPLTAGTPVRLLVSVTIPSLVSPGTTLGLNIASGASVVWTSTTDYTTYPISSGLWQVYGPVSVFPAVQTFDQPPTYSNMLVANAPGSYPTVITPGAAPGSAAVAGTGGKALQSGGPVLGLGPESGAGMMHLSGNSGPSVVAIDFLFDMSVITSAHYVELDFWWANVGLVSSASTDALQGVFLSTNGGTTWHIAVFQFPASSATGIWFHEYMNLTAMLNALSLTYTNQVMIRFQMAGDALAGVLLDEVSVSVQTPHLRTGVTGTPGRVGPGAATDRVVSAGSVTAVSPAQTISSFVLTKQGTIADSEITEVKLWADTNADGALDAGDTQLGTTQTFSGGSATFSGSPLGLVPQWATVNLLVTFSTQSGISNGTTFGVTVNSASAVTTSPGPVGTYPGEAFPLNGPLHRYEYVSVPYMENFETFALDISNPVPLSGGWLNRTDDGVAGTGVNDWYVDNGGTSSGSTGPNVDHNPGTATGKYLYVEDSNTPNGGVGVILDSPVIPIPTTLISATCEFWVHANCAGGVGSSENFLHIDIIDLTAGATIQDVISAIGHVPDASLTVWTMFAVNLTPYIGHDIIVRFRLEDIGVSFQHDVAIDNFSVDGVMNSAPSLELPTAGSAFTGTSAAGYTATVAPGPLTGLDLELFDADLDPIDVVSVTVVPSAPAGITAPVTSSANTSGTVISFTGDASQAVPGIYDWTITIDDGFGVVMVTVSLDITDAAPGHTGGPHAGSGDGSLANPYTGDVALGGMAVVDLATVTDPNVPQTLTEVSVTPDGSNPSSLFQVGFSGTGNSGGISATPTGVVTYLDIGDHVFTVTVTDGNNPIDIVVRVTVQNTGNVQPVVASGGQFLGTRAGGFTLAVDPGTTLLSADLMASDMDADDIEVVSVQVSPPAGLLGVTAPAPSAAAPTPTLSWTGTVNASEVPGDFVYTITISDGITPPVTFTVTITLLDVAPQQAPVAGVTGDGSAALPYAFITQVGKTPAFDVCNVSDQNLSQTVTLVSVTPDALNPTGGAGFDVALTGTTLSISALGALKSDDVGTHVFTANLTDGTNNIQVVMRVKVNTIPEDPENGSGCSGTNGSSLLWLLLALGGALVAVRVRTVRE